MTKETPKKKVMVNMLNQGMITAGWESQVMAWMQKMSNRYYFHIFFPSKRPISANRNQIAKDFMAGDWDYLVMLDNDNPCHKNILELLDLNLPVVGGVYPGRDKYGIMFHVYQMFENPTELINFRIYPPEKREGLQKVDAIGTGLIVIQRWVIEKMYKNGYTAPFEDMFQKDGTNFNSDDMAFCLKCKKLGIDVYAHYDYIGSHWKEVDLLWIAQLVAYAAKTGKTNFPHE